MSPTPLQVCLTAPWYMTNQAPGVSTPGSQGVHGLECDESVWAMPHRRRQAMVRRVREMLLGEVASDEPH
jgi:hypothetical protein